MISVFDFENPTAFLQGLFSEKEKNNHGYSLKRFAAELGFSSLSLLKLVLYGKRNLKIDQALAICETLRFSASETEYLEQLVHEGNSLTFRSKQYFAQKRMKVRRTTDSVNTHAKRVRTWENPTFLSDIEMTKLLLAMNGESLGQSKQQLIQHLSSKTSIDKSIIAEYLPRLEAQPCLKSDNGVFRLDWQLIIQSRTGLAANQKRDSVYSEQLKHCEKLLYSKDARDSVRFLCHTFTLNKADFNRLFSIVRDLPISLTENAEANEMQNGLAQLNIQFFLL
jgi:uncharacterized protein (TIGR02147 family)